MPRYNQNMNMENGGILSQRNDDLGAGFNFEDYAPQEMNQNYMGGSNSFGYIGPGDAGYIDPNFASQYGNYDPMDFAGGNGSEDASQAGSSGWEGAKNFMFGSTNEKTGVRTRSGLLPILNTFTGLASAYLGMKQYGLAKDSFKQNKKEFGMNYDAQRQLTNAQMEGSAKARHSANPGFYATPSDYMAKNSIAARRV